MKAKGPLLQQNAYMYSNTKSPIAHPFDPGLGITDMIATLISYPQQFLLLFSCLIIHALVLLRGWNQENTKSRIHATPRSSC